MASVFTSAQFWISLFAVISSAIGIWWYYVNRSEARAKEQREAIEKAEAEERATIEAALKERQRVEDEIKKQTEAREKLELEREDMQNG